MGDNERVPDHASVLDSNVVILLVDLVHLLDSLVQRLLSSEHGRIGLNHSNPNRFSFLHGYISKQAKETNLHSLLHLQSDIGGGERTGRVSDHVQVLDRLLSEVGVELLVGHTGLERLGNVVGARSTKDDNVKQRVGSESVRSVDGHTGGLSGSIQSRNDLVLSVLVDGEDLSGVLGRDSSHAESGKGR